MAYRAAVVGGSGYTGAELLRLLAGHPEIEVVHVTADSNAGARGRRRCTRRSPPPTTDLAYAPVDAGRPRAASTSCSCALPHGASQALVPDLLDTRRPRRRPRRRLPAAAPTCTTQWYGEAHTRARAARPVRVRAASSCTATRSSPHAHVAVARLLPDRGVASRWRRCSRAGLVEPTGIVVDAVSGVSGAGRGLEDHEPVLRRRTRTSPPTGCSRTATPREMEQALAHVAGEPVQVLFTPHLVPMTRGILATCYARPATDGPVDRRACSSTTATFYADEPFVRRRSTSRRPPRRRSAPTSRTSPCASTPAPTRSLAIARRSTTS